MPRTGQGCSNPGTTYTHRMHFLTRKRLLERAAHIPSAAHLLIGTAASEAHQPLGVPEATPRPAAFHELDSALPPQAAPPPPP